MDTAGRPGRVSSAARRTPHLCEPVMPRLLPCVLFGAAVWAVAALPPAPTHAAGQKKKKDAEAWKTPELPGGKVVVTDASETFLNVPAGVTLKDGVTVAKAAPT